MFKGSDISNNKGWKAVHYVHSDSQTDEKSFVRESDVPNGGSMHYEIWYLET